MNPALVDINERSKLSECEQELAGCWPNSSARLTFRATFGRPNEEPRLQAQGHGQKRTKVWQRVESGAARV